MKKTLILAAGLMLAAGVAVADVATYDCATYGTGCNNRIPAGTGSSGDMDDATITIPDGGPCSGRAKIFDVNVLVEYNHTFNGDISARVTGPDDGEGGTSIELFSGVGGSSNDMCVELDDQSENGPITGRVGDCSDRQPEGGPQLCKFNGGSAAGTWTLSINDNAGGDIGALERWEITVDCQTKGKAPLCEGDDGKGGRGLGSWANNGRGNGDDLPPRGQRGR